MKRYWRRYRNVLPFHRSRLDLERLPQIRHPVELSPAQLHAFCELFDATQNLVASIRDISESEEYNQLLRIAQSIGHTYTGEDLKEETNQAIKAMIAVQRAFNITTDVNGEENE